MRTHERSADPRPPESIVVVGAVIVRAGLVLCAQRGTGSQAGLWEFPGGKVEPGEDPRAALARELEEEIGVRAHIGAPLEITFHAYEEKDVLLLFYEAHREPGSPDPVAKDVADWRWATAEDLDPSTFPPADLAILQLVRELL